jgi:hypothetical protein
MEMEGGMRAKEGGDGNGNDLRVKRWKSTEKGEKGIRD